MYIEGSSSLEHLNLGMNCFNNENILTLFNKFRLRKNFHLNLEES